MKLSSLIKSLTACLVLIPAVIEAKQLVVYSSILGRVASDKYTCRVREVGTDNSSWKNAFVIQTKCKINPNPSSTTKGPTGDNGYYQNLGGWSASYIAIEFEGMSVEVEITRIDGPITKAKVRPTADASAATISGGKAYFILSKNTNVNIDINGQMEDQYTGQGYSGPAVHTISVFANPVYTAPTAGKVVTLIPGQDIRSLNRNDWDAIKFAPGVHNIGKAFELKSSEILYIPGDAIVHGTFQPLKSPGSPKNWQIYGSGAISGENNDWTGDEARDNKTFTNDSEGVTMEGFVVIDPANHTFNLYNPGTSDNIYLNLKIFGWRKNSDGVNAFKNAVIRDCFFRVQDDAFYLGTNVRISNITTWNDSNGAVLFLTKSSAQSQFQDIKVIYHRASWHYWSGGRIISMRDTDASIEDALIKNILVEDPFPAFGPFFGTIPSNAGSVTFKNIVFENIRQEAKCVGAFNVSQSNNPQNTLVGGNNSAKFQNLLFRNCYYGGKYLRSLEDGEFVTNQFIDRSTILFDVTSTSPTVTVTASSAAAAEPSTHGQFTFTRTGDVGAALTVNYSIGGTASNGTDYQNLGTSVSFAVGQGTVTQAVNVIADTTLESTESVILTLASGTGYTVGSSSSATVTIADAPTTPTPTPTPSPTPNPSPSPKGSGGGGSPSAWFFLALSALGLHRRSRNFWAINRK